MPRNKGAKSSIKIKPTVRGRPADRKGTKRSGQSATPHARGGVLDTIGDPDRTPEIGIAQPSPIGRHNV